MIILDAEPEPQKRLSRRQSYSSDVVSIGSSQMAPPSYRSEGSRYSVQPMLESDPPRLPRDPKEAKKTRKRRIWKGIFYALAVYAVASVAIAVPYFVTRGNAVTSHSAYQRAKPPDYTGNGDPGPMGIPVVPVNVPSADGASLGCNGWDSVYTYGYPENLQASRLTYCIPHNSTNLWLHALGGQDRAVSGQFTVKPNPDDDELDYMVDVMLTYDADDVDARNSSAICLMQENDKWGVGIYKTPPDSLNHSLKYQLTLLVPHAKGPLNLPQFTTYLPWFSHSFHDLNNSLIFGDVEIGGVESPVDGTISGQKVNVTTSLAAITGNYHASNTLVLQTSFAKIDTNITLGSAVGQEYPTSLFMRSSEGPFSATVHLSAAPNVSSTASFSNSSSLAPLATSNSTRPWYSTKISCDDSPVTLVFRHDDSVDFSDLDVQVNTTLNRAVVLLDSKFEGNFDLISTNGSVIVADLDGNQHNQPEEMTGTFPTLYRRSLEYEHQSASRAQGCVKRGPPPLTQKVNLQVRNHLALVALGFVKPGDNTPSIGDLGLS
ncbi:hypothetical protein JB92DRAFT_3142272 [Gautieria morchelliformis]|nr:hypothetical protein JB92DRAFT_3142272 [Gautieria morchelliformis]